MTVLTEKIKLLKINFHGNTVISQQTLQAHENIVHGIKLGKIIVYFFPIWSVSYNKDFFLHIDITVDMYYKANPTGFLVYYNW